MLLAHSHKGFIDALHDALRADVDSRAGGHLAVHHQTFFFERVEVLPCGPMRHQIVLDYPVGGLAQPGFAD
jgi:hypothetical protein